MFIAIVGTRLAGKSTVQNYLVKHKGFLPVKILQTPMDKGRSEPNGDEDGLPVGSHADYAEGGHHSDDLDRLSMSDVEFNPNRTSFLTMISPISSSLPSPAPGQAQCQPLLFRSSAELLAHITKNWRSDFVTLDLDTKDVLAEFLTRPFVVVVSVDAPLLMRYRRSLEWSDASHSLEEFIREHDAFFYGPGPVSRDGQDTPNPHTVTFGHASKTSFRSLSEIATVHVVNSFETVSGLHDHLETVNLLEPERLRPGWDTYFMELASLASQRSNCMKRRVGAILVRNKRVVSTGYNGTPRGLTNCNEGGCTRCNSASETPDECLCLHAEENALLEAGRERVGDGSVLYCNTCPCLKCTIKIIQTGVKEVVYNLSYKVDDASAALFSEAGVILRRHAMPV
ncbi:cytidine deaminase-like protein [Cerioporus squamosus]|nr:cytidine deaminase-like protein [Cerioporus squamosus]